MTEKGSFSSIEMKKNYEYKKYSRLIPNNSDCIILHSRYKMISVIYDYKFSLNIDQLLYSTHRLY